MKIINKTIQDLLIVETKRIEDNRGVFNKPWVIDDFKNFFKINYETYVTTTKSGVLRGLHYQKSPYLQKKLIYCLSGEIKDLIVDLRPESSTYGHSEIIDLSENDNYTVIVPEGCAHGILSITDSIYLSCSNNKYSAADEDGILWNTVKKFAKLPVIEISQKDENLPSLKDFLKNG